MPQLKPFGIVVAMDAELIHLLRAYPAKETTEAEEGSSFAEQFGVGN